ncbi:MAG: monovalent cation/H(+) antiporter subunit G [Gammaproteobacteria bacterium]
MIIEVASWCCVIAGAVLSVIGGIGMHRFPDFYTRVHAAGTTDTLCAALFLLGLALQAGLTLDTFKLFLIFSFLFLTSPTAAHALANTATEAGLKPLLDDDGRADT